MESINMCPVAGLSSNEMANKLNELTRVAPSCKFTPLQNVQHIRLNWKFDRICRPHHFLHVNDSRDVILMDLTKRNLLSGHAMVRSSSFIGLSDYRGGVRGVFEGSAIELKVNWDEPSQMTGTLHIGNAVFRFEETPRRQDCDFAIIAQDYKDVIVASKQHWLQVCQADAYTTLLTAFIWRLLAEDSDIIPAREKSNR